MTPNRISRTVRCSSGSNILGRIVIIGFISVCANILIAQSTDSSHLRELNTYFQSLNAGLLDLIQISKQLKTGSNFDDDSERYILISDQCTLYEELDPQIEAGNLTFTKADQFELVDERGEFVNLKYGENSFWVARGCTRRTDDARGFENIMKQQNKVNLKWYVIATSVWEQQQNNYKEFQRYLKKNKKSLQNKETKEFTLEIQKLISKIETKKYYVDQVYSRLSAGRSKESMSALAFKDILSGQMNLMFGSSNFNQVFFNSEAQNAKGGNTDFNILANYQLNRSSEINFLLNNQTETRLSPYSNWHTGLGYRTKYAGHIIRLNTRYETYSDKLDSLNDYRRIGFNGGVAKNNRNGMSYALNYQFMNHGYELIDNRDYSQHRTDARLTFKALGSRKVTTYLQYNRSNSDGPYFDYNQMLPGLKIETYGVKGLSVLDLYADFNSYDDLPERSNRRFTLGYRKVGNLVDGVRRTQEYRGVYRSFENFSLFNYADLTTRFAKHKRDVKKYKRSSWLFRARLLTDTIEASYLDLRQSYELGAKFFLGYDFNVRAHYPAEQSFGCRLDGYLKTGIDIKGIRIGPIFSWHLFHDFKSEEGFSLESAYNSFRYGAEASGQIYLLSKLQLGFRASYDLNTVYTRRAAPGQLEPSDIFDSRNPSNFQMNINASYQLYRSIAFFARATYFKHETDYIENPSLDFLKQNNSTRIQFGLRLQYN